MTAGELKDYCNGQVRPVYRISWPSVTDSQGFHSQIFTSKRLVVFSLECSVHVLKNTRTFARYHLKPTDFRKKIR